MQPTRRLYQPVDFTDLRRPVLYSGLIGEVKPMPGDFGLTGLRRPAVAGHRVVLVVKSVWKGFPKVQQQPRVSLRTPLCSFIFTLWMSIGSANTYNYKPDSFGPRASAA